MRALLGQDVLEVAPTIKLLAVALINRTSSVVLGILQLVRERLERGNQSRASALLPLLLRKSSRADNQFSAYSQSRQNSWRSRLHAPLYLCFLQFLSRLAHRLELLLNLYGAVVAELQKLLAEQFEGLDGT